MASIEYISVNTEDFGDTKDSTAWTSASMELAAKTLNGNTVSNSGIKTAESAKISSCARPSLLSMELRWSTEILVTSLPVPQVVGIRIRSLFFFGGNFFSNKSQTGVNFSKAKSLATSKILPPPIPITLL